MKPIKTWILVADGAQARFFLNDGPGRGLTELTGEALRNDLKPSRDIDADRPGRAFDSGGQGRHAMEPPTDSKRHAKRVFAARIADKLRKARNAGAFDRIVLVAAPTTLGDLRAELSKDVLALLHGELAKDLTHLKPHELRGHLGDMLAV